MTKEERLQKQRERLVEMKLMEKELHAMGYKYIAGVDEVGRGPLAGPVVAAAVVLPENFDVLGIDDSKKISEKKREELFDIIKDGAIAYGIGIIDEKVIDEINILEATKEAMRAAISELERKLQNLEKSSDAEADTSKGLDYILFDAMKIDDIETKQKAIIKGDSKVLAIAAASIIAKVTRDRMMVEMAEKYPGYAFEKNKGYGTKDHYEGIRNRGICEIHRKTFLKNINNM